MRCTGKKRPKSMPGELSRAEKHRLQYDRTILPAIKFKKMTETIAELHLELVALKGLYLACGQDVKGLPVAAKNAFARCAQLYGEPPLIRVYPWEFRRLAIAFIDTAKRHGIKTSVILRYLGITTNEDVIWRQQLRAAPNKGRGRAYVPRPDKLKSAGINDVRFAPLEVEERPRYQIEGDE